MEVSEIRGTLLGSLFYADPTIWASKLGAPIFVNPRIVFWFYCFLSFSFSFGCFWFHLSKSLKDSFFCIVVFGFPDFC